MVCRLQSEHSTPTTLFTVYTIFIKLLLSSNATPTLFLFRRTQRQAFFCTCFLFNLCYTVAHSLWLLILANPRINLIILFYFTGLLLILFAWCVRTKSEWSLRKTSLHLSSSFCTFHSKEDPPLYPYLGVHTTRHCNAHSGHSLYSGSRYRRLIPKLEHWIKVDHRSGKSPR